MRVSPRCATTARQWMRLACSRHLTPQLRTLLVTIISVPAPENEDTKSVFARCKHLRMCIWSAIIILQRFRNSPWPCCFQLDWSIFTQYDDECVFYTVFSSINWGKSIKSILGAHQCHSRIFRQRTYVSGRVGPWRWRVTPVLRVTTHAHMATVQPASQLNGSNRNGVGGPGPRYHASV